MISILPPPSSPLRFPFASSYSTANSAPSLLRYSTFSPHIQPTAIPYNHPSIAATTDESKSPNFDSTGKSSSQTNTMHRPVTGTQQQGQCEIQSRVFRSQSSIKSIIPIPFFGPLILTSPPALYLNPLISPTLMYLCIGSSHLPIILPTNHAPPLLLIPFSFLLLTLGR